MSKNNTPSFKDWSCSIGEKFHFIDSQFEVYDSFCQQKTNIGNFFEEGIQDKILNLKPKICQQESCTDRQCQMIHKVYSK